MTAPQRGNLTSHDTEAAENPAIDEVMAKIDSIKTSLRSVLEELNETDRLLRRAIKERKANDKEINRARTALRSLQAVEL
jgi:septal ring factor EnvC (AmiA/AmiB activator)